MNSNVHSTTCPHLGLKDDPASSYTYPNAANHCFHCRLASIPAFEHQGAFCLSNEHAACPVFAQAENGPFPQNIRFVGAERSSKSGRPWQLAIFAAGIFVIGLMLWLFLPSFSAGLAPTPMPSGLPTSFPSSTPEPIVTKSSSLLPLPATKTPIPFTSTPLPSPTPTDFPPQERGLDTSFLIDEQPVLMHRVVDGEQIALLAKQHQTAIEVIQSINYNLTMPLYVGRVIVIAPGLTQIDPNLPNLEPYQVTDAQISIEDLSIKLRTDSNQLKYYNRCSAECKLSKGEWLLIPHQKTPTPLPPTPIPSLTPTEVPSTAHTLENPILVGVQPFLLHRAAEGEQIVLLIKQYQTTLEVLRAINYKSPTPLLLGKVIVIAPGLQSVDPNLPALEPYQVIDTEINIDDLGLKLGVNLVALKYYNGCVDGCQLVKGDWLLLPHVK